MDQYVKTLDKVPRTGVVDPCERRFERQKEKAIMGGSVADVGAVPTPTKTLREYHTNIINAFAAALDEAIRQSEVQPDFKNVSPLKFTCNIAIDYPNKKEIRVIPVIDFSKDPTGQFNVATGSVPVIPPEAQTTPVLPS